MATADLLPNESHASANVSLLACLQKLFPAALKAPTHRVRNE